ncbi:multiple epidermal growth factor-like domains protein 10 [Mytilus californianus]|uniref:multiple epidermal growth factor-like domains protein 10 n=1 Tax=Mytilus californianus TaxID=6549 RepID=UPI002246B614|nr:multiple epidermal growth factor-like domains protein 10 [Mytilus californianus]
MTVPLLIYLFSFWWCQAIATEEGRCYKDLRNGKTKWHCCDNREEKDGRCTECLDGFKSDEGEPCHPCLDGNYGRKCGEVCRCKEYQICDHIKGCLNSSVSVTVLSNNSTYTETGTVPGTETETESMERIFNTEMMIVIIICTGIITLAILICMVWFRYHVKKKRESNASHLVGKEKEDVFLSNGIHDYIEESEIREMKIKTTPPHAVNEKRKSNESFNSNDINVLLEDEYLNPYQPIVPVQDIHGYCGKEIVQGILSDGNLDDNVNVEETDTADKHPIQDYIPKDQEPRD